MGFWWRPFLALAGFSLLALFIGVAKGMDAGCMALALLLTLYLLRQLWQESRLAAWLEKTVNNLRSCWSKPEPPFLLIAVINPVITFADHKGQRTSS